MLVKKPRHRAVKQPTRRDAQFVIPKVGKAGLTPELARLLQKKVDGTITRSLTLLQDLRKVTDPLTLNSTLARKAGVDYDLNYLVKQGLGPEVTKTAGVVQNHVNQTAMEKTEAVVRAGIRALEADPAHPDTAKFGMAIARRLQMDKTLRTFRDHKHAELEALLANAQKVVRAATQQTLAKQRAKKLQKGAERGELRGKGVRELKIGVTDASGAKLDEVEELPDKKKKEKFKRAIGGGS